MPVHIQELITDVTCRCGGEAEGPTGQPAPQPVDARRLAEHVFKLMQDELTIARERE